MALSLLIALLCLIAVSAFFSGSETAMMALNRYRIRHLAQTGNKKALLTQRLLQKPERLLGIILIGNTFANIIASALATLLAHELYGDAGVAIMTVILTLVILLFAEVLPKTFAAYSPRKVAFTVVWPLNILLKIFYPLVWLLSSTAKGMLRCFGFKFDAHHDAVNADELKSIVNASASALSRQHQHMLLGILDLETATVADCMIHKSDITAFDYSDDWPTLAKSIAACPYSRVIVYQDTFENIIGVLPVKKALRLLLNPKKQNHATFKAILEKPVYIPETTTLKSQLKQFQQQEKRFGIVVDEYGALCGIVTVEDIIEEVMGEFTEEEQNTVNDLTRSLADGSHLVQGSMTLRDVNRDLHCHFPTDGPKTLNGLIIEYVQSLPKPKTTVLIQGYPIEIISVKNQAVETAKIHPRTPS